MKTITIDKSFQIWEVAAKDDSRPVLSCVCFRPNGTANASNGFALATVPVTIEGDDDDEEVLVSAEFLKRAATNKYGPDAKSPQYRIIIDGDSVYTFARDMRDDILTSHTYPDFTNIIPNAKALADIQPVHSIAFNIDLAVAVCKALGRSGKGASHLMPLYMTSTTNVILVPGAGNWSPEGYTGLGLIMPMYIQHMKPAELAAFVDKQRRSDWYVTINGSTEGRYGPMRFGTYGLARKQVIKWLGDANPDAIIGITKTPELERTVPDLSEWDYESTRTAEEIEEEVRLERRVHLHNRTPVTV